MPQSCVTQEQFLFGTFYNNEKNGSLARAMYYQAVVNAVANSPHRDTMLREDPGGYGPGLQPPRWFTFAMFSPEWGVVVCGGGIDQKVIFDNIIATGGGNNKRDQYWYNIYRKVEAGRPDIQGRAARVGGIAGFILDFGPGFKNTLEEIGKGATDIVKDTLDDQFPMLKYIFYLIVAIMVIYLISMLMRLRKDGQ